MKIIELKSENIKRIKAIEITPKDNMVIISGKNDQGKTSILDSIWYALEGKASLKDTPMPIRKGEKKAEVKLILDDFIVTRNWTANDKSYLKVTNREGLVYGSPQELLDSFIGKLAFDPLEFAQMKENEQRNLLIAVTGLDIDSLDSKIGIIREERRMQGQEVKLLSGEREEITIKDLPKESIDVSKLSDKYDQAMSVNNQINLEKTRIIEANRDIMEAKNKIKDLEGYIRLGEEANKKREEWLSKNKSVNTDDIKLEINNAYIINDQIRIRERNKEADKKQKEAQGIYSDYTNKIDKLETEKQTALSNAKMPITGLGISETGIIYNGFPFSQLSSSEQLKVSLAIAIALNPKLKVIRIVDGSLLDSDNMELIKDIAKEKDYQIWIERVNDTGELCFVIEDGELVDNIK